MRIAVYCEARGDTGEALIALSRRMAPDACVTALHETADAERYAAAGADEAVCLGLLEEDCAQGSRAVQALEKLTPDIALFPATVRGRFLSAWAAARLGTGLTADCTGLELEENGLLRQIRPAYGNNLTAQILCREKRPQMASVRPGVFPPPVGERIRREAKALAMDFREERNRLTLTESVPPAEGLSLQDAPVVVAGGKGIGSREGFRVLQELAELLGGAVGATRSAVDAGWVPYSCQIGQTGTVVRPRLYLAFGISGMIQHTVGMNAAKTVVAVNTDRNAPIFRCADYGIIAPWRETAEYMIGKLKERKARR